MSDINEKPQPSGIACPRCSGTGWKVTRTRARVRRLMRVRTCKKCQFQVRTRETIELVIGDERPSAAA